MDNIRGYKPKTYYKFIDKFIEYRNLEECDNYIIIDVRKHRDFSRGSLPYTIHCELLGDNISEYIEDLYKNGYVKKAIIVSLMNMKGLRPIHKVAREINKENKTILIGCRHAKMRSRLVSFYLKIRGINNFVLRDGINKRVGILD